MDTEMRLRSSKSKQMNQSFFKILLDDTAPKLQLPPVFVKKLILRDKILASSAVLEIHCGKKWTVETENDGEACYFNKGWLDFVRDTKTETGDLLAFFLLKDSTFSVSIFGPSGSEKDLTYTITTPRTRNYESWANKVQIEDEDGDDDEAGDGDGDEDEDEEDGRANDSKKKFLNPCSVRTIRKYHRYTMRLPSNFLSEKQIGSEGELVLRNKAGKEWDVVVKRNERGTYLCSEWSKFRKENKIMKGDILSFQYFQGDEDKYSFIQVTKIKEMIN